MERGSHQGLENLRLAGGGPHRPGRCRTCRNTVGQGLAGGVDQGANTRSGIDVRHRDGGIAHAEGRYELGCRQRAAAVGEEVRVQACHAASQHGLPLLHDPLRVFGQVERGSGCVCGAGARQRPGQRVPVHFAARFRGQAADNGQHWYQRGGERGEQQLPGGRQIQLAGAGGGEVANQDLVACRRRADRGSCARHARKRLQCGVDFAEFDPAAAQLDLFIGASDEDQARGFVADQVAGAVGAVPREGRHGGVFFRVLLRVEVAGQADASDDEFADFALADGNVVGVDHSEVPAVEGQPDPDRAGAPEGSGTGDHRRFGRSVGVPHLPAFHGEPFSQFRRAGLPAEDQQPDVLQGLGGPQRSQCGHRGHHRDAVADQPRPEIHPRPHQNPRCRHQAGAVAPGQPHLLAGGVERHGQAGEDAVLGAGGLIAQEDPRLSVNEGRGR